MADIPNCNSCVSGLEETTDHVFFHRIFWDYVEVVVARINHQQFVQLDIAYVVDRYKTMAISDDLTCWEEKE